MNCKKCNHPLIAGDTFCSECGTAVVNPKTQLQVNQRSRNSMPEGGNKKSRKLLTVGIILAVISVLALSLVVVMLIRNNSNLDSPNAVDTLVTEETNEEPEEIDETEGLEENDEEPDTEEATNRTESYVDERLIGTWAGTFVSEGNEISYGFEMVISEDNQVVASYFSDDARTDYLGTYLGFARIIDNDKFEIVYTDASQSPDGWVGEGVIFSGMIYTDMLIGYFEMEGERTGDAMLTRTEAQEAITFDFSVWGESNFIPIESDGVTINTPFPPGEFAEQSPDRTYQFIVFGEGQGGGWWYRVDAQIGVDNSTADSINRYIDWIANRECTIEMSYETSHGATWQSVVFDVSRIGNDGNVILNSTYVVAFEHEGKVVVIHINFAFVGNFNESNKQPFFEAYGFSDLML